MTPFRSLLLVLIVHCCSCSAAVVEDRSRGCRRPVDVVVLLDTSRSIYVQDFPAQLSFVNDFIGYFDASAGSARIAVASYSQGVREEVRLDSGHSLQAAMARVARIHFTQGGRIDGHSAIKYATDLLSSKARDEAARIIVYITNGRATVPQQALQEAKKARTKGILLFTVGVGKYVDTNELAQLAYQSRKEYVYFANDFNELRNLLTPLTRNVCSVPAPSPKPVVQCKRPADIVFLVDTSRSIYYQDFPLEKEFVQEVMQQFDVSPSTTRFAVVSYSQGYRQEFDLNTYQTPDSVGTAVERIQFTQGGRIDSGPALQHARDLLRRQGRKGAAHVIIYVTNGRATDRGQALEEAMWARKQGVALFAVGVGSYVNSTELGQLASKDSQGFVHTAATFSKLHDLVTPIAKQVCSVQVQLPKKPEVQCKRPADIVFLVDTSRYIYYRDFPLEKEFVQEVMQQFDVSPSTTRFAVVSYSQGYREEFGLDKYMSADSLSYAVGRIPFSQGGRMDSDQAIRYARDLLTRQDRQGAVRVIIYITSGRATDRYKALEEAGKVKKEGILLFAVGAGRYLYHDELSQLATRNTKDFVHSVNNFTALHALGKDLGQRVCKVKAPEKTPIVQCRGPAELVFLVDTSRSIYPLDFPLELNFVQEMIEQFHISPATTRVAVVSFSEDYKKEFGLDKYQNAKTLHEAVGRIPFTAGGRTDTDAAIKYARDVILRQSRKGATRIVICITDGRSTRWSKTIREANKTRQEGILMFAVGVGQRMDRWELGRIATKNTAEFVHFVNNFGSLSDFSKVLSKKACAVTPAGNQMDSVNTTTPTITTTTSTTRRTTIPTAPTTPRTTTPMPSTPKPTNAMPTTPEPTTPEPTTPETTTPEPTTPEPTTPETTTPEPTTPEPTTPEPTTPEPTTPESTTPEITTPEPTTPEPTTPETTTPEPTTPEPTTPEFTTFEPTTPEPTTPEPTTPEPTTPEPTTPEPTTTEPTTTEPTTPEPTTPEPTTPEPTTPEPTTFESTTPEPTTPEPTTPELTTPEPTTPEPTTPEPTTFEPTTPEPTTPEPTTPEPTTPEPTTPEPTTPEPTTPEPTTPEPTTPEPTTPEPTTPEPTTPEPTTPEPTTPEPTTPEPTTPEPTTPEPTTPELITPEPTLEPTTPEPTTPEPTPEPTTPEPTTPEPTTPKPSTPEPTTHEPTTPELTTPEPTTPEHTTPEPTTPEPTTPELITPEPTTPKPTTPEPITQVPTTSEPTTSEPTTPETITSMPTTSEPTSYEPTNTEPTTPEPTTPEPITLEPTTPELMTVVSTTPEPTTPEPTTPEPTTPKPTHKPTTPEPTTPEPTSEPISPDHTTPESSTLEPSTPEPTTLEPTTPEPTTPGPTTPEPTTPEPITPEPTTPESSTPEPTTPESSTPEPTTPESSTPEPTTPESSTPEPTTPESSTPEPATPEPTTPEPTTPEPTTPEPTTLQPTTPETTTPESSTPEPTTPETTTPESSTPEPATLEPTTPVPTTPEPTTPEPITPEPTTPTTVKPTTVKPTTAKPITTKPTTANPTTAKPITTKPTTAKPTTAKPTTTKHITTKPTTAKPTTTTTATTTTTTITTTTPEGPRDKRSRGADVVLVLDRSSSVDRTQFARQLYEVQDIVGDMDVSPGNIQVATVSYGPDVKVEFHLKDSPSRNHIQSRIGRIQHTGGFTRTGDALNTVRNVVFSPAQGARGPEVPRSVVLITNGMSQNILQTQREANLMKNDGVRVIAVGMGPRVDRRELELIASQPSHQYAYHLDDYTALPAIRRLLTKKACHMNE